MTKKDKIDDLFDSSDSNLENLLSGTLYLMSFYSRHSCPAVRRAIRSHLFSLAEETETQRLLNLNVTINKLINSYWSDEETMPESYRSSSTGLLH